MRRFLAMSRRSVGCVMLAGSVMFVQSLGAFRTLKLVALTGNAKLGNGRKKDGE